MPTSLSLSQGTKETIVTYILSSLVLPRLSLTFFRPSFALLFPFHFLSLPLSFSLSFLSHMRASIPACALAQARVEIVRRSRYAHNKNFPFSFLL